MLPSAGSGHGLKAMSLSEPGIEKSELLTKCVKASKGKLPVVWPHLAVKSRTSNQRRDGVKRR